MVRGGLPTTSEHRRPSLRAPAPAGEATQPGAQGRVELDLVWFPGPLADGSQAGTLSRHSLAAETSAYISL